MSRIGRLPIAVPAGVTVTIDDNNLVTVKGPKGTLSQQINPDISVKLENNEIKVARPSDDIDRGVSQITKRNNSTVVADK